VLARGRRVESCGFHQTAGPKRWLQDAETVAFRRRSPGQRHGWTLRWPRNAQLRETRSIPPSAPARARRNRRAAHVPDALTPARREGRPSSKHFPSAPGKQKSFSPLARTAGAAPPDQTQDRCPRRPPLRRSHVPDVVNFPSGRRLAYVCMRGTKAARAWVIGTGRTLSHLGKKGTGGKKGTVLARKFRLSEPATSWIEAGFPGRKSNAGASDRNQRHSQAVGPLRGRS